MTWKFEMAVPQCHAMEFERHLSDYFNPDVSTSYLSEGAQPGIWQLEFLAEDPPEPQTLDAAIRHLSRKLGLPEPDFHISFMPPHDWLRESQNALPPLKIGRFYVHQSHDQPPSPGAIPLRIDAGQAFGTGHHESTAGCLHALDLLQRRMTVRQALDVGCGSGILALAIAKTWHCQVLAGDIDPISVACTRANVQLNGVRWGLSSIKEARIYAVVADGPEHREFQQRAPYQLITANILAHPLIEMAPGIARKLARLGVVVLSGLLETQQSEVLAAYRHQGLRLSRAQLWNGWATLILVKP